MNLKQIGSYGANILGRPADHILKERIKDSFKRVMATRIRQSVERHGIDDMFKVSFDVEVDKILTTDSEIQSWIVGGRDSYVTKEPIPYPVRFQNDSPFTYVGINGRAFRYVNASELRQFHRRSPLLPHTGELLLYQWKNTKLYLFVNKHTPSGISRLTLNKIRVESIFPDPEEILMKYDNENDGQDIIVPFADDMVENILYEILKTEYGFVPKETVVTVNPELVAKQ